MGGPAAACTSPLARILHPSLPAYQLITSHLPASPPPLSAGDDSLVCSLSVQRVGGHAAANDSTRALNFSDFTGEPVDGKLSEAYAKDISAKAIQSDLTPCVCSASSQRHRSRSPMPARQDSAPCNVQPNVI